MWGYWDNGPIKDEIGTLNLLTPMVVKQASAEIKTGEHVQLDWGLENVEFPSFGRRVFENKVMGKLETEEAGEDGDGKRKVVGGACVLDNELHFNTQSGSQWDGHKHVSSEALHIIIQNQADPEDASSATKRVACSTTASPTTKLSQHLETACTVSPPSPSTIEPPPYLPDPN